MPVTYDMTLVALSVVIAGCAAYTCFHLTSRMDSARGAARKGLLAGAAVTMGGGIWSMHFIAMLAFRLPVAVGYDLLLTLISALIAILVTGAGLLVVTGFGPLTRPRLAAGGLLMGLGIATMHYTGMAAMRADVTMTYDPLIVAASVAIAVAASSVALWLAVTLTGFRQRVLAAAVMGVAISGMHYTGMAAVTFAAASATGAAAAPILSQSLLASIIAVTSFLIFGLALLTAVPERRVADDKAPAETDARLVKLPVQKNKATLFVDLDDVVSIQADAHYTRVFTRTERYFCPMSLTAVEARLDPSRFLRVHRSHIVNIRHAKAFERQKEQAVILLDGLDGQPVPVSRGRVAQLKTALGF
jgi:NO-binding membrane sensor protein with MHYT domain